MEERRFVRILVRVIAEVHDAPALLEAARTQFPQGTPHWALPDDVATAAQQLAVPDELVQRVPGIAFRQSSIEAEEIVGFGPDGDLPRP